MSKIYCTRCLKEFKYNCHLQKHLNKKTKCQEVDKEQLVSIIHQLKETNEKIENIQQTLNETNKPKEYNKLQCKYCDRIFARVDNLTKHIKKGRCKYIHDKINIYERELGILSNNNEKLTCRFCKTTYKHKSTYSHHMAIGCKARDEYEQELEDKVLNRREQAAQIINNNYDNSTNNTINIHLPPMRAFGDENHDYITTKVLLKELMMCKDMNDLSNVVGEFTKLIHCDPAHPENHNVALQSLNGGFAKVFNGKTFESRQAIDVQDTIIQNIGNLITEKCDEVDDCSNKIFNKLEQTRETIDEDIINEKNQRSIYRTKVKSTLHNNKRTINSTQNLIE